MAKRWQVTTTAVISMVTWVEANDEESAKKIALDRPVQRLCHQCDGNGPSRDIEEEWRVSIDGEPDPATTEATELEDDED